MTTKPQRRTKLTVAGLLILAFLLLGRGAVGATTSTNVWAFAQEKLNDQFQFNDFDPGIVVDGSDLWVQSAWNLQQTPPTGWRRYKGPDIDHLTQQADSQFDSAFSTEVSSLPGGSAGFGGWWSTGIWRDSTTGTWYTTVQAEYDYPTPRAPSYNHTRKIYAASSTDQGAHWHLIGAIVSADATRGGSPGTGWRDFGTGDQKLFIDSANGYFYLYYMDGWIKTSSFGLAGLTMKVARCSISATDANGNHMYPGCWHKWYGGTWTEAGLGGHDAPLWASPNGVEGEPVIFYSSYLNSYVATANGWMATASDLSTQNWSAQDLCWPANGLWYNWAFDPATNDRYTVGQTFRLYSSRTTNYAKYATVTLSSASRTTCGNLVANGSFETGSLSSWTSSGSASASSTNAMAGSYSAKLTGVGSSISQTITGLLPNTTYRLRGWAFVDTSGDRVDVSAQSFGGSTVTAGITATDYYNGRSQIAQGTPVDIRFTTGAVNTSATINASKAVGSGSAYVDELTLSRDAPRGDPTLQGEWQFDEGSGTGAADSTGNGNTGALNGGTTWASGQFGNALSFDGSTGYVSAGVTNMPAANAAQTISWWMKVSSYSAGCAVCLTNNASSSGVQAGILNSTTVGVWKYGGTTLVSATAPSTNAWHHYAYTYDGTTHRLYIDGTLAASATTAPNSAVPADLNLGRWSGGTGYLSGQLDDVRIYSRTLSSSEVSRLTALP